MDRKAEGYERKRSVAKRRGHGRGPVGDEGTPGGLRPWASSAPCVGPHARVTGSGAPARGPGAKLTREPGGVRAAVGENGVGPLAPRYFSRRTVNVSFFSC